MIFVQKKETALHHGCEAGNVDICSLLLDSEAWLDAHDFVIDKLTHYSLLNFIFVIVGENTVALGMRIQQI